MSRLLRCNRCGQERETPMPVPNILGIVAPVKADDWAIMTLGPGPLPARYDLCEDCTEVLVEQFLVGATVAPITQPAAQVVLPHDPMTDCQLVWNPGKGGFLCYHDDPELYHALIIDNAQNVAEGVPEKPVRICSECGCVSHRKFGPCSSTGCECTLTNTAPDGKTYAKPAADQPLDPEALYYCPGDCGGRIPGKGIVDHMSKAHQMAPSKKPNKAGQWIKFKTLQEWGGERLDKIGQELQAKIGQVADDMHTAGWAHSIVQRCSAACSEAHTYVEGCILKGVVQPPQSDLERELDKEAKTEFLAPNPCGHMYPGTPCDWNHCATPGRLISQQGEDLTEAYSPQEAAE